MTSFWRNKDAIIAWCVCWALSHKFVDFNVSAVYLGQGGYFKIVLKNSRDRRMCPHLTWPYLCSSLGRQQKPRALVAEASHAKLHHEWVNFCQNEFGRGLGKLKSCVQDSRFAMDDVPVTSASKVQASFHEKKITCGNLHKPIQSEQTLQFCRFGWFRFLFGVKVYVGCGWGDIWKLLWRISGFPRFAFT